MNRTNTSTTATLVRASLAYDAAINTAWDNYLTATDAVIEKYAAENPNASDAKIWELFDSLDGPATAARNAAVLAAQSLAPVAR